MGDIADAILAASIFVVCTAVLLSALALVGALMALVRSDHRNPIMRLGLEWYEHRINHG